MTGDYCINCQNADVTITEIECLIFCQKRMAMITDITKAFNCVDFEKKEDAPH